MLTKYTFNQYKEMLVTYNMTMFHSFLDVGNESLSGRQLHTWESILVREVCNDY